MGRRGVALLLAAVALASVTASGVAVAAVAVHEAPAASDGPEPVAPRNCDESRELLAASSALDGGAGVPAGHLIACIDDDHRRLTIHNRTPIVWSLGDASVRGVTNGTDGVTGLLALHASQSSSGLLLAPGSSASVSAGDGTIRPRPDAAATRILLALTAIVSAQDELLGPDVGPDRVFRAAALTCAVAVAESGSGWDVTSPRALTAGAADPVCGRDWAQAVRSAAAWRIALPTLTEALEEPSRAGVNTSREAAAAAWFESSRGFSWGGVERPAPLP
ncbi:MULTISPECIES: hypothetical protein [unclassified Rathayibacter]|uniref:hypothetical protein n=1 Tax=unclassified Rathayibacter TaxID=2609250 RepID=UPI00188CEDBC|nr:MULTISPECIES: hypothetical protein [unclassified Rathayibacter]MBF4463550.1 hypothetical protein [Rathayibacter sp. VKM Ac-2879]MBF4505000.1 hypothetical protein [Rathayibacter sp. VKM Ac-2878]